ncbi:MAG: hypothetical protein Fur0037_04840 [Planctomycetota bacterium]
MNSAPDRERVFAVRRADFFGGDWPQGFLPLRSGPPRLLSALRRQGFLAIREEAESRPDWKQLIPYCVLRHADQVFCVERRTAQVEVRLHGLLSIGIGGHVDASDVRDYGGSELFEKSLLRELAEELAGDGLTGEHLSLQGFLNDDSTEVGRVHFGLVYRIDLPGSHSGARPRVREISKMTGGFRSLVELAPLWQDPMRFESWSRVLIQAGIAGHMARSRERSRQAARDGYGAEESNHG